MAEPTNWSSLGFEAQTNKSLQWFWWLNHQTRAASFEAQTRKSFTTLVLRLNQETHSRFWGQTGRNRHHQFWGQIGENGRSRFWGQTARNRRSWFWGQTARNRRNRFWSQTVRNHRHRFWRQTGKTVWVVLRSNHSQTVAIGFEAHTDEKLSEWFCGQTTHKPSTLVLRLNQETHAPRLHVHGLRSSAPGLLLLPWSSSLDVMPHLPPAHHETSKRYSPNETKIKEKQNETIPDSNSNLAKSMIHHNQTKKRTTCFLNLPLDESIDNKSTKFEVWIQDPMKHS
jgi:hypothetical protein